jgi:beta-xylosidase
VQEGWQTVLRSRNIFGPYEDKIVLHQGSAAINGPHQGALVDTANGEWWFMHFQDVGVYGRVVHLQPVQWRDGWPMMGALKDGMNAGEPVLRHAKPNLPAARIAVPATSDEFSSSKLGLQWQWHANHRDDWFSLLARPGWLRLYGQLPVTELQNAPHLLLQKFPARSFVVETILDFSGGRAGDEAGLIVTGRAHAALALRRTEFGGQVVLQNGAERIVSESSSTTLKMRVSVGDGGLCRFSFCDAVGKWIELADTFQSVQGVWIGAKVGIYSLGRDHADFGYFRFTTD